MEEVKDILVPPFVNDVLAKSKCEHCERGLGDACIRSAGVRLDDENTACFFATIWCAGCETGRDFLFKSRKFRREEWWQDVGCWVSDAARPDRVHTVLASVQTLPDAPVLLRERGKVNRLDLIGAYAGEIGPVVFLYLRSKCHPAKPYGAVRLERHDRLRFLTTGEREALPVSRWLWFTALPATSRFQHKGKEWQKLSVDRVREIVRDRVFEPWRGRRGRDS